MKFVILVVFAFAVPAFAGCIELPKTTDGEAAADIDANDSLHAPFNVANVDDAERGDEIGAHSSANESTRDTGDATQAENASATYPQDSTDSSAHSSNTTSSPSSRADSASANDSGKNVSASDSENSTRESSSGTASNKTASNAGDATAASSAAGADAASNETAPVTNTTDVEPTNVDRFSGRVEPSFLGIVGTVSPARTVSKSIQIKNVTTHLVLEAASDVRVQVILTDPSGRSVYDKTLTTHMITLAITKFGTWRVEVRDAGSTTDVSGAFSRFAEAPSTNYTAL